MTLLWSPNFLTSADFVVEKSAVWGCAWVWQNMCVIQDFPDAMFLENDYGGYRVRLHFKESFWGAESSAWRLGDVFQDVYALAPGSDVPISAGAVNVLMLFYPQYMQYVIVVESVPNLKKHCFAHWPQAAVNAGLPNFPAYVPDMFFADLETGMTPQPVIRC